MAVRIPLLDFPFRQFIDSNTGILPFLTWTWPIDDKHDELYINELPTKNMVIRYVK